MPRRSGGRQKGSLGQVSKTLREVIARFGAQHAPLIETEMLHQIQKHGAHAPEYIRLAFQYNLGRPPEQGDQAKPQPLQFFLLTGKPGPGGRDPIQEMRTIEATAREIPTGRPALATGLPPTPVESEPEGETFERL